MTAKRQLTRNMTWSWLRKATAMLSGFLLVPVLVDALGHHTFGIWVIVGSVTGYFALLDLGTRSAVGRKVAFFRARGDTAEMNGVFSTAAVMLGVAAALALVGTALVVLLLPGMLDLSPAEAGESRAALALVGLSVALGLALNVFDATLWAFQRFDVLNAVEIAAEIARFALVLGLARGGGLVVLAAVTLLTVGVPAVVKAAVCLRLPTGPRLGLRFVRRRSAKMIFGYGLWNCVGNGGRMLLSQSSNLIIAARLGVPAVTPYAIALRLVGYATALNEQVSDVFMPVVTTLHAQERREHQQNLFLDVSRYNLILALFFLPGFVLLGGPFLALWVGSAVEMACVLLVILAVGECLPMSQMMSGAVVLGMGRPRILAWTVLAECLVALPLAYGLAKPFGLVGVAAAFATCGAAGRGFGQLIVACRLLRIPLRTHARRVLLPAVLMSAPPTALLAGLILWKAPATWVALFAYGAGYGLCFAAAGLAMVRRNRGRWGGVAALRLPFLPRGSGVVAK